MDTVLNTRIFKELGLAEWIQYSIIGYLNSSGRMDRVLNTRIFKELSLAEWIEYLDILFKSCISRIYTVE